MAEEHRPEDDAQPENAGGQAGPQSGKGGLDARLDQLNRSLAERNEREEAEQKRLTRSGSASGFAAAMKMSSELIAGVGVGALIGWLLDKWLGTAPWAMAAFLLLGFAAGILNMLRSVGKISDPADEFRRKDGGSD
ncbi:AtpZ/AtpI family protein [Breoghania sp.]|uniref:AtpZ/AtpI family protein n=1 Tax=Breoghania sp. TaxID=2065378 RepID=UPI002AAAA448|nr:AtpZ/AtpI family protein [Breoghania sp.]